MKKYLLMATIYCSVFSSCVDLDLNPHNQISSGTMWTSPDLAQRGMNGLMDEFYCRDLGNTQLGRQESGLNRQGIESLSFQTAYYSNSSPSTLLTNATKGANDFQIKREWQFCYTIIHACNDAIANLHKAGLDKNTLERYYCEARFLRAWSYHRLNMLYQGVPVYLEPISNAECTKGQSSAEEVWNYVLDDLKFCIENENFPDNTLKENYGRPSKGAAYALRGMVYMWKKMYSEAVKDFNKVKDCGYSLYQGKYIDLFTKKNEKNPEMIFTVQFDAETGFCDNIVHMVGARDNYDSWTEIKPSVDFVDYYQNSDGSKFNWEEVPGLEDWNKLTVKQREVFFCRNGLETLDPKWKKAVINRIGQDVYDKYYLNDGNEERIKKAYDNRDPRLKQTIATPYEPIDCYKPNYNNNNVQKGKELRWPAISQGGDGGDLWLDKRTSAFYMYKKYNEFEKGAIVDRDHCETDWPLIRYTDVLLQLAEALTELNDIDGAINLVNQVRSRANMPSLTNGGSGPNGVNGKDDMLERIRYEKRVEFPVEAINFFDEIRWGTLKESKFQGKNENGGKSWWGDIVQERWYYEDYMWPWSAPLTEIQKNPNLTRREGWAY
ncbi:RagB/SusD family nutrient uptake outer membrane protein [Bacteroides cellulolyticus]|jgi:hypothetical protein|uniref:RagB/SusD family nutrient uptake outer membrane protein n=2 Tax=Bacteroides TaxID=816 RepID=UPI0012ABEB9D|nr:RagB/SusD family nutrient uptake outer membrane protein [Bacteroides cellulolyticus]MCU6771014.1 RagB/SusD family nutrient uptake outer membrane protein [Bacteroides cellulolyticus]